MISPDPITIRVEKLRFLVEEMELAFALSRAAPDAWEGRMLARHVLVRACDFIDHARALKPSAKHQYGGHSNHRRMAETGESAFGRHKPQHDRTQQRCQRH